RPRGDDQQPADDVDRREGAEREQAEDDRQYDHREERDDERRDESDEREDAVAGGRRRTRPQERVPRGQKPRAQPEQEKAHDEHGGELSRRIYDGIARGRGAPAATG